MSEATFTIEPMSLQAPHPWRTLRQQPWVDLIWADLPRGVRGVTDGARNIWLDRRLTQRERRCTLMHELVHLERQHTTRQDARSEASVRRETARRLLPDIYAMGEALAWAVDMEEAADELWVTRDVLEDRLGSAHPAEIAYLRRRLEAQ